MSGSDLINLSPNQASGPKSYNNYTDIGALNDLKREAREDQRAALRPVAEQFEALFVEQILKEARKVSFDDGWLDSDSGDTYKDWYDKQLAQDLSAKGTLGFADKIVEQLAPRESMVSKWQEENVKQAPSLQEPNETEGVQSTHEALALRKLK